MVDLCQEKPLPSGAFSIFKSTKPAFDHVVFYSPAVLILSKTLIPIWSYNPHSTDAFIKDNQYLDK